MKKIWLILAAVIVLAIGGVSVYISMIDWNQHKDKIAAQFNDITGKRVVLTGRSALRCCHLEADGNRYQSI